MKPWTEPEKLMNFLSKEAGPQLEISRKIACMIHACLNEVEQFNLRGRAPGGGVDMSAHSPVGASTLRCQMITNRFIRRAEFARRLGIHPTTTNLWERSGRLPPAESLSYHVVGWHLVDLPPEFQRVFEDRPSSGEGA